MKYQRKKFDLYMRNINKIALKRSSESFQLFLLATSIYHINSQSEKETAR